MRLYKLLFLILLFTYNLFAQSVKFYKTSFDCTKTTKNSIEYNICTNNILSIQDLRLSYMYKQLIDIDFLNIEKIKSEHKTWINLRNSCKYDDYTCLKNTYSNRIKKLTHIYDLVTINDFSTYKQIKIINPEEKTLNKSLKYHFNCTYNKDSQSLIIARDRDFYFIDELSKKIPQPTKYGAIWNIFVNETFIDKKSNEQILKGTIILNDGATYQPSAIEFFTYSKNWNCKLKKVKY